ncbi:GNAT family N-acetyltransferase [Nonomuraea sp. KM90]|uniref:GNAT family N-acetyltransferase n=1 Tax=Nonomuraea sp. KM90 TaxID=3457428 RepID=UPI003FCC5039
MPTSGLLPQAVTATRDSLDGAVSAPRSLPAHVGRELRAPTREAFASGLNVAAAIAAITTGGAANLAPLRLRHLPPAGQPTSRRGFGCPPADHHNADSRAQSKPAVTITHSKVQSHHKTIGFPVVLIRRATADDASAIHGMMRELADSLHHGSAIAISVDRLKEFLTRPEITYLVAEKGGQAIGYVSWFERVNFWSGTDYFALDDLYVCGEERGRGVGEQLMRAVAKAADGRLIRWEVAESNVGAQRFYERIGASLVSKKICRWQEM